MGAHMTSDRTRTVVRHHLEALKAGDVEEILSDYAEDAVMVTNLGGVTSGVAALRSLFAALPPDSVADIEVVSEVYDGDVGVIVWTTKSVPFGTDSFVLRDGKIAVQTAAVHLGA